MAPEVLRAGIGDINNADDAYSVARQIDPSTGEPPNGRDTPIILRRLVSDSFKACREEPRRYEYQVSFGTGERRSVLAEGRRFLGAPWRELEAVVTAEQAGRATLRFAARSDEPSTVAF